MSVNGILGRHGRSLKVNELKFGQLVFVVATRFHGLKRCSSLDVSAV